MKKVRRIFGGMGNYLYFCHRLTNSGNPLAKTSVKCQAYLQTRIIRGCGETLLSSLIA